MNFFRSLLFFFLVLFNLSCSREEKALFPVQGTSASLSALNRGAAQGTLDFSKPKKLEYRFDAAFSVPPHSSFEIEYDFSFSPSDEIKRQFQLVMETGTGSWALPLDLLFLGIEPESNTVIRYAIPMEDTFAGRFSITLVPNNGAAEKSSGPVFRIRSLRFTERWFGFYRDEADSEEYIIASPFAYKRDNNVYVIDLPAAFYARQNLFVPGILAVFSPAQNAVLETGGRRFEALSGAGHIHIPPALFSVQAPALLSAEWVKSFTIQYSALPAFPAPIEADPALVLEWPAEMRRNSIYEVFRWDRFPSLLIFDFADYAAQDRFLKRLAFFVEKAGFRGRLAPDAEIAELHGWNAHDYRAADLARFFDAARKVNFPLLDEERELERILLNEGIIRLSGSSIVAGNGGIISISGESADYLRRLFMAHEGFHGLFFIDEDFRDFSRRRWEQLGPQAKRFIVSYFGYQQYDTNDEYLLINEFMAHILQQSVSQAGRYFGQTLPSRLESSWRSTALPPKDEATDSWPALATAFIAEAEAFSAYVNKRWGLAAGRVWTLTIR